MPSASGYDRTVNNGSQVLVLGGGIAGLAAAYELHQRRVPFTLLEAGPRVGGVIFSEPVDGFNIDGGPDSLLIQKPEGIKLCQELGLGDRLVVDASRRASPSSSAAARCTRFRRLGPRHSRPSGGRSSARGCSRGPASCAWAWSCSCRGGRDAGDESIGAFMRRRFGVGSRRLPRRTAARRHSRRRRRPPVDPRAVSAVSRGRARIGSLLRAFRAQPRHAPSHGRRVHVAAGRAERTRRRARGGAPVDRRSAANARSTQARPSTASLFRVETSAARRFAARVRRASRHRPS